MIDLHIHLINKNERGFDKINNNFKIYQKKLDYGIVLGTTFPRNLNKRNLNNHNLEEIVNDYINIYGLTSFKLNTFNEKDIHILSHPKILGIKFCTGYYKYFYSKNIYNYIKKSLEYNKKTFLFHTGYCNTKDKRIFNVNKIIPLIKDFENCNFIIAHLGNPLYIDTIKIVKKYKNAYTDLSGILGNGENIDKKHILKLKMIFSIIKKEKLFNKILWGTDFPIIKSEKQHNLLLKIISEKDIEEIKKSSINFIKSSIGK